MIFLAPWALVVGGLAAAGAVVLHLVARQRPAAYVLPTTRFIPDRRTLVSRIATRPRDLALLALRLLLLASASLAFARPVLSPSRAPRARLVLLDRSGVVADPGAAVARVRTLLGDGVPSWLIAFDTATTAAVTATGALDSLARDGARTVPAASISAALVAARRSAGVLAGESDSVELVLVSPVADDELDAATDSVRARWPGRITVIQLPARSDTSHDWTIDRPLERDDPLAPALSEIRPGATSKSVRLRRAATSADSAFARSGGTLVVWDTAASSPVRPQALAMGDDVVVALLRRGEPRGAGRTMARWSDGTAAAIEAPLGSGCIRSLSLGFPIAGDLPLRPDFQRVVRGLMAPCGGVASFPIADSAVLTRLAGTGGLAAGDALIGRARAPSRLVPWLLGLALACALLELLVRARTTPEDA